MTLKTFCKLIACTMMITSLNAVIHVTSSDMTPASFIYKAKVNDVLDNQYSFKDSSFRTQNNKIWSVNAYPTPSIGTDVLLLDPANPENIILYVRKEDNPKLALPGGYMTHMKSPLENAVYLFHWKIALKDGSKVPLDLGTAGIPILESMTLNYQSRRAPFLGAFGFKDRAPGGQHIMALSYHMVTTLASSGNFASPDEEKVAEVVSCKMIDLLAKGIDFLLPGDYKNGHYLTNVAIPSNEELGSCALELHHDHLRQIFKFYTILTRWGLIDTNTGNVTDKKDQLKFLYLANPQNAKFLI